MRAAVPSLVQPVVARRGALRLPAPPARPAAARPARSRGLAPARAAYEALSESSAAIRDGNARFAEGDWAGALSRFQAALTLPGSGVRKDRSKPAELSTGEKQAIYYNLALSHSALGEVDYGLEALEMALKCGFGDWVRHGTAQAIQDYNRMTTCEELAALRTSSQFQRLLDDYNVVPSRLAVELDFGSSSLGRFTAAANSGFKAKD